MSTLGKNIAYYRRIQGLNQKELSKKIGISRSFMSQIENDISNPSEDNLKKIAEVLNVSIDDLATKKHIDNDMSVDIIKLLTELTKIDEVEWLFFGWTEKDEIEKELTYINNIAIIDNGFNEKMQYNPNYFYKCSLIDININYYIVFDLIGAGETVRNIKNIGESSIINKEMFSINTKSKKINRIVAYGDDKTTDRSLDLLLDEIVRQQNETDNDLKSQIIQLRTKLNNANKD